MLFFENYYLNVIAIVILAVLAGIIVANVIQGILLVIRTIFDIFDYPEMKKIKKMMVEELNKNPGSFSMEEFAEIEKYIERTDAAAYYWHKITVMLETYISTRNMLLEHFNKKIKRPGMK